MNILILTSSHPTKNAGIVAYDLYKGLSSVDGNDVRILTKEWGRYNDKKIVAIHADVLAYYIQFTILIQRIINKFFKVFFGYQVIDRLTVETDIDYAVQNVDQTITFFKTKKMLRRVGFNPDVIISLFMPNLVSYKNLYELNRLTNAHVYTYLMDMAPFTGACHYAWDCKGYLDKCGNCPALFSKQDNDQSRLNWRFKKDYIQKMNISAIACTTWQYKQLEKSSLYKGKQKFQVMLGINESVFKPGDKDVAKTHFNLPLNKRIIFFGAAYFDRNRNKGFKELIETLNILKANYRDTSTIHLAIAGNKRKDLENIFPFEYTYLGYLNHKQLAIAFQAADLFVCPSIEDSGPMMVNQSIMSGTPVVAFEMGVAIDLIRAGKTGYLSKLGNCDDLAKGIMEIIDLSESDYSKMSQNCRDLALEEFTSEVQIQRLMKIFTKYADGTN